MTFAKRITEARERREAEKAANLRGLATSIPRLHKGTYSGSTSGAEPKTEPYRDPVLLEMANGRPCFLEVRTECIGIVETTVACHSNLSIHGKGKSRKADDQYSVWGCFKCHRWLDSGMAKAGDKERTFVHAHARQVLAWRWIAQDPSEPERFRKAAQRALERLNATAITEAP